MYYSDSIITAMQAEKILALKLEHALSGVKDNFIEQVSHMSAGAQRLAFYTSCFTENYQDVCANLKNEEVRFIQGVYQLFKDRNIIFLMIRIYIELLLKKHDDKKIEKLQRSLMDMNVKISSAYLNKEAFITAITTTLCLSFKTSTLIYKNSSKIAALSTTILNYSGLVQQAADSANQLKSFNSIYYTALYARTLEMMYFIIEPVINKTPISTLTSLSDQDIINIIKGMIR
jgi:hypothetical protein